MCCFRERFSVSSSTMYSCRDSTRSGELFMCNNYKDISFAIANFRALQESSVLVDVKKAKADAIYLLGNIMGSCWPGERSDRSNLPTPLPKNPEQKLDDIRVDGSNSLIRSYFFQQDKNIFEKTIYDWKSIPITNQFHCRGKAFFTVRNRGIKDDNFVVGVIKRSAVSTQMSMPWRTHYCICYESHRNSGQSGLIYGGKMAKVGETVGENETIRVIMGQDEIQFRSTKKTLAYMKLPVDFLSDQILPYVALFHIGDKIEFMHPVVIQ